MSWRTTRRATWRVAWIAALLTVLAGSALFAVPAEAATARCIPAANFLTLARISDGSMSQLADLLGLPGQSPPDDGCYAVLLSGPIDKGSAAALAAAVARNKGWLAQVYIAVSDGDLGEEAALAHMMRDFALTGVLLEDGGDYVPDFLALPRPLPASVSNSWPESELPVRQPLALSFKDYLDNTKRRIGRAARPCGAACWSILAGAIERRVMPAAESRAETPGTVDDPRAMRARDALRTELRAGFGLIKASKGYVPMPRVPPFAAFDRASIEADCRSAIAYTNALEGDLAQASNAAAAKRFPFWKQFAALLPRIRRLEDASGKAELCMRKGLARLRMKAFRERCKETCGDTAKAGTANDPSPRSAAPSESGNRDANPPVATSAPPPSTQGAAPFSPTSRPQRSR